MKKGIWVWGLCCLAVVACKEEQHPQLPRTASGKLVYMVLDSLLTEQERELKAEYIHLVPDYLLTEKQARLKKWKEEVEDKHFQFDSTTKLQAFDMTLEEFLQTGFQEAEYWAFKAKIARNNQWVKDTMPKLQAKWKAFAQSMKLVEIDSISEDWHPESYYTNEGKIIPAWVREEVSAEEYRIIEQLNERYDLHFTLWGGPLEELAVRISKEKTQATVDFLLNPTSWKKRSRQSWSNRARNRQTTCRPILYGGQKQATRMCTWTWHWLMRMTRSARKPPC